MATPKPPERDANGRPIWARNAEGKPICGKQKRSGGICQMTTLGDNGRCQIKNHNGGGGRPPTHGGRSMFYKKLGLLKIADKGWADPQLGDHRRNVLLFDTLIQGEAEGIVGPPAERWRKALEMCAQLREQPSIALILELEALLESGLADNDRLDRIERFTKQQREHQQALEKREHQMQGALNATQIHYVLVQLVDIIKKVILNPEIPRERIPEHVGRELVRVFHPSDSRGSGDGLAGSLN